ncbi:LysM peptidoglycan-binding domain-containing protein, partial [Flavobacteriaceae bacterium]|nr:LysM peptidoglycan-binding domain-containing protein [Flavobacteriaceae bacterium]
DTLYSIARQYSISVSEIKKYNNLSDNTIFKGQELLIPKKK